MAGVEVRTVADAGVKYNVDLAFRDLPVPVSFMFRCGHAVPDHSSARQFHVRVGVAKGLSAERATRYTWTEARGSPSTLSILARTFERLGPPVLDGLPRMYRCPPSARIPTPAPHAAVCIACFSRSSENLMVRSPGQKTLLYLPQTGVEVAAGGEAAAVDSCRRS